MNVSAQAWLDQQEARAIACDRWPHRIVPEVVSNPGDIVFMANRFY